MNRSQIRNIADRVLLSGAWPVDTKEGLTREEYHNFAHALLAEIEKQNEDQDL